MAEDKEFKIEVIQHLGTLSDWSKKAKEFNIVKWGEDSEPKFDLRVWNKEDHKPGKGITLTVDELQKFKEIVDKILAE